MRMLGALVWGAQQWQLVAIPIAIILLLLLLWNYITLRAPVSLKITCASFKALGIFILLLCLMEPLFSDSRARKGANLFIVLTDNSRSMTLRDRDVTQSRAEQLAAATTRPSRWLDRIGEDFELREHAFDARLHAASTNNVLKFDGDSSNLGAALTRIQRQYQGRPLAGVLLLTDGSATDSDTIDRLLDSDIGKSLPPIYPVLIGNQYPAGDINLQRVDVSQTNFEDAPVTLTAQLSGDGMKGRSVTAQLVDETGKPIDQQIIKITDDITPLTARFKLRPEKPGVSFYRIRVAEEGKLESLETGKSTEATLFNNTRLVAVDRGKGPYRILYVAGRPNWEFKFLQRSISIDDQVQLLGLIRIAKREPKFNYLGRAGDSTNPLYRGFGGNDPDQAEQYDQPVLTRIGTKDQDELRAGFPRTAAELNQFHAIIFDDLEAEFFTQEQMQLIKEFVRQRGGGLLMLGGQESFKEGKYDRTAIGDLLPVYFNEIAPQPEDTTYKLSLTREGWLEPWIRLRPDESAENARIGAMPAFQTLNGIRGIKPGATILASASVTLDGQNDKTVPALVEQRFGKGRSAALLIGDLWRWSLGRPADAEDDLPKAWRQMIRWLVSEVPKQVEITIAPTEQSDDHDGAMSISVRVRDGAFSPLDNASVTIEVLAPDGQKVNLTAEASSKEAGLYESVYVSHHPGAYRASAKTISPDGNELAAVESGWTADPAPNEFRDLKPNLALLEQIAGKTGGKMVSITDLDQFAEKLPTLRAQITEPDIRPLWHEPWVFLLAIACFAIEWGLRRMKGLP